jgi:hypothetical protein
MAVPNRLPKMSAPNRLPKMSPSNRLLKKLMLYDVWLAEELMKGGGLEAQVAGGGVLEEHVHPVWAHTQVPRHQGVEGGRVLQGTGQHLYYLKNKELE